MSHVQFIPLKALQPSPLNARKTGKKEAVEELAASIAAHGLLQGLTVVAVEGGRYQVSAGGRRLAALKLLQKRKVITGEFEVPCTIVPGDIAEEASLAENVQRVAMHPLDEVEAFGRLAASGLLEDAIAARFGASVRHVRQRLALSALSPVLKAAFRRGEIGLEAARAFCLVPEHDAQERVFALMTKPVTNGWSVRAYLTQGAVRATDRLARFVGLDAYAEAGGVIRRDLFEDDMVFLDSPELLQRLAGEKLEALKAPLEAEGWGWVTVALGATRADGGHAHRLRPDWREPTQEEIATSQALSNQADALQARLSEDDTNETLAAELADVHAAMTALREGLRSWDPEKQKLAGCIISVSNNGEAEVMTGVVTSGDQKKINRIDQRRAAEKAKVDAERRREKERREEEAIRADQPAGATGEPEPRGEAPRPTSDGIAVMVLDPAAGTVTINGVPVSPSATDDTIPPWEDDPPADGGGYTQKTMQELTSVRTRALRSLLAADPGTGLALAVYALGAQQIAREGPVGLSVHAFGCLISSDAEPLASAREALGTSVPDTEVGWFGWCMAQNADTLLATLAMMIASTLDLSHTGAFAAATRRQAVADALATRLQLDMTGWWTPDEAFFTGLTKAQITDAILASPAAQALETDADREAFTKQLSAKRKDELAAMAAQSLDGSGWLPEPLRTAGLVAAHGDPCFAVTDQGLEALAASEAVEPDVRCLHVA
ncbi:MAG: ParB/RepB/Spo0J family partition protein [Beijerinckiaceae bacterium]|jgi:ParB family chromosome partitioning protein|nr:ParB/RepB/Spo0J family partition protein [Beijerinckiaceae bacterium]